MLFLGMVMAMQPPEVGIPCDFLLRAAPFAKSPR